MRKLIQFRSLDYWEIFLIILGGYKFGASSDYSPIPALSTPAQIIQTAGKTNGSESNQLSIGMKLADNLESGNYTNKLILSFVSNPYTMRAMMTEGPDFNTKLKALETTTNKIEYFKKSPAAPATSMNAVNIEDEESDYEIKLWLDPTDKTAYYCTEPEKVYLNTDSSKMFSSRYDEQKIKNILEIDLSSFDTSLVTNMEDMFAYMSSLTTLNLSSFDTSKVTDMRHMFDGTSSLTTLNLSSFDTSKVTDMSFMFSGMYSIGFLDISNFNTSKVENMDNMFRDAKSIESITFGSKFNTSKVISMASMFNDAPKLKSLDLSNFDTSNVTDMNSMFNYTLSLSSLKFGPNFVTDKVKNMLMMFVGTCSLNSLDLSTFKTTKLTNVTKMFALLDWDNISFECLNGDKLKNIYVSEDFDISNINQSADIFTGRKNLRGGAGSSLSNPSTADKTWLRIDDPAHGRPGYFTRKS